MQVGGEDAGIFKDGAVLNDGFVGSGNLHHVAKALVQEVNLQVERPSAHVFIVVSQVGIVVNGLEVGSPSVALGKHLGERCFSASYVSGNSYMHISYSVWVFELFFLGDLQFTNVLI